ncbi:hypothetical protein DO259_24545 [Salmonella enterica]|nr:hypothetical protein [Salmonella enterica]EAP8847805.1 hypothetical protein [Salmonella enterica]EAP9422989.1 hypothetical protein [Salmonella enterica]EAU5160774.1 hypothetical protein [Salmonella enterica]EBM1236452.1 hypothetical protein [Salmonella enterica]
MSQTICYTLKNTNMMDMHALYTSQVEISSKNIHMMNLTELPLFIQMKEIQQQHMNMPHLRHMT